MVYQIPIQCESWVFAGLALDQEFINNAQTCRDSPPPLLEEGKWGKTGGKAYNKNPADAPGVYMLFVVIG